MAKSVIQSVIFVSSQQFRKFTWQRIPKEKPISSGKKHNIFQYKWVITLKKYLQHKIWYWNNKLFLRIKLQFALGDVFRRSLYSSRVSNSEFI